MKRLKSLFIIVPILVFSWGVYIKLTSDESTMPKEYCVNRMFY